MRYWWDDYGPLVIIGIVMAMFAVLFVLAFRHDARVREAFMQQCLEDGRKEYECASLLRGGDPVFVPIILPR